MWLNDDISCCGIREISSLAEHKSPEIAVKDFVKLTSPHESRDWYTETTTLTRRDKFRYAVFSGTKRGNAATTYVERFAAYLLANKLGEVMESTWNKNPNSGNQLKVCVWTVDWDALKAWSEKQEDKSGKGKSNKAVTPDEIR